MSHYALVQLRVVKPSSVKSKVVAGSPYKWLTVVVLGFGITTC